MAFPPLSWRARHGPSNWFDRFSCYLSHSTSRTRTRYRAGRRTGYLQRSGGLHNASDISTVSPGTAVPDHRAVRGNVSQTQEERRVETRTRLLAAAAELFAEQGIDSVSVDAVA